MARKNRAEKPQSRWEARRLRYRGAAVDFFSKTREKMASTDLS